MRKKYTFFVFINENTFLRFLSRRSNPVDKFSLFKER